MTPATEEQKAPRLRALLQAILPPLLIVLAVVGAILLVKTRPRPQRRPPAERAAPVRTVTLQAAPERIVMQTAGTVVPARRIALKPRVSGEITEVSDNFIPGGRFEKGETILQLDEEDYQLAIEERAAQVAAAELQYQVELGQQQIAEHEWGLIEGQDEATELERALTLREPHLRQAEAALEAARAQLSKAELDLSRTAVRAPFNAIVLSKQADLGAQITPAAPLAELVGADAYWVEVTLRADRLGWVRLPGAQDESGSRVRLTPTGATDGDDAPEWTGEVIELRPALETAGRLAQLIVSVKDPLKQAQEAGARSAPLLLGAYVHAEIEGPELEHAFAIPRRALREGDTVWLKDADSRLEVRPIAIVHGTRDRVLVTEGLSSGDALVVTDIPAPVPGMLLRDEADALAGPAPGTGGNAESAE